jgi:hypothetical protein
MALGSGQKLELSGRSSRATARRIGCFRRSKRGVGYRFPELVDAQHRSRRVRINNGSGQNKMKNKSETLAQTQGSFVVLLLGLRM